MLVILLLALTTRIAEPRSVQQSIHAKFAFNVYTVHASRESPLKDCTLIKLFLLGGGTIADDSI